MASSTGRLRRGERPCLTTRPTRERSRTSLRSLALTARRALRRRASRRRGERAYRAARAPTTARASCTGPPPRRRRPEPRRAYTGARARHLPDMGVAGRERDRRRRVALRPVLRLRLSARTAPRRSRSGERRRSSASSSRDPLRAAADRDLAAGAETHPTAMATTPPSGSPSGGFHRAAGDPPASPTWSRSASRLAATQALPSMMGTGSLERTSSSAYCAPTSRRDGCLRVNTGGFDPVARLTYQEQAALALNAHLTQGAGSVPTPGDYYLYLRLAEVAPESDLSGAIELYEGIDPSLAGLADYPGRGGRRAAAPRAGGAGERRGGAAGAFRVDEPWRAGADLLELHRRYRELIARLDTFGLPALSRQALERYLSRKQEDAATAAAGCLGLRPETAIDRDRLTPGESARLRAASGTSARRHRPRSSSPRACVSRAPRCDRSTVRPTGSPPNSRSPSRPTPSSRLRTGCALRTATTPTPGPRFPTPANRSIHL